MKKTMRRLALILLMAAMLVGMFAGVASAKYIPNETSRMPFSIQHSKSGDNTTLRYTVLLKIGEEIAEYASVTKDILLSDGSLKMKTVRFVCYLEDELVKEYGEVPEIQNNDIFEFISSTKTEKGLKAIYKVKDEVCENWANNMTAAEVKQQLMSSEMFITVEGTMPTAQLHEKCYIGANGTVYLLSYGRLIIHFASQTDILASTKGMEYDTLRLKERDALSYQIDTEASFAALKEVEEFFNTHPGYTTALPGAFVPGVGFWVDGIQPSKNSSGYWFEPNYNPTPVTNETYRITPVPAMLNDADHFTYIFGYDDGDVRPTKSITRAEVATIFYRLLKDDVRERYFTTANTFSDVSETNWFNIPVSTMANAGIVNGYPDGSFRPNAPITRAEFATVIAKFDGNATTGSVTFRDVYGHWAKNYVDRAAELGWINGYSDGTFRPNQNITRAETAAMINRVLNRAPQYPSDLLSTMKTWSDNANTANWYYLDIQEATNSHSYVRKDNGFETWQQILPNKTWTE